MARRRISGPSRSGEPIGCCRMRIEQVRRGSRLSLRTHSAHSRFGIGNMMKNAERILILAGVGREANPLRPRLETRLWFSRDAGAPPLAPWAKDLCIEASQPLSVRERRPPSSDRSRDRTLGSFRKARRKMPNGLKRSSNSRSSSWSIVAAHSRQSLRPTRQSILLVEHHLATARPFLSLNVARRTVAPLLTDRP